jgi:hypothetical protein
MTHLGPGTAVEYIWGVGMTRRTGRLEPSRARLRGTAAPRWSLNDCSISVPLSGMGQVTWTRWGAGAGACGSAISCAVRSGAGSMCCPPGRHRSTARIWATTHARRSHGARRRGGRPVYGRSTGGPGDLPTPHEAVRPPMAGSFIDRTDPTFDDLGRREVINLRCNGGREVQIAPFQLIGQHGIAKHTKVWSLRDRFRCLKCRRRPPAHFWVAKWQN